MIKRRRTISLEQLLEATTWSDFLQASSYASRSLRRFVNQRWKQTFSHDGNLRRLLLKPSDPLQSDPGYGLIYFYLVRGRVRYVGQTRAGFLRNRLIRWYPGGKAGYRFAIKRSILAAYYSKQLRLRTLLFPVGELDRLEQHFIGLYGSDNRLWNKDKNSHFRIGNLSVDNSNHN